jgi:hypothetical protein
MIDFIKKIFKRKKKNNADNPYAKMGSVGVSPEYMLQYQKSVDLIKKEESKW